MTVKFIHSYTCVTCKNEIQEHIIDDCLLYTERLNKSKQMTCNKCHTQTITPSIFNEFQRNNIEKYTQKYKNICFCGADYEKIINTRNIIDNWLTFYKPENIDIRDVLVLGLMSKCSNGTLIWALDDFVFTAPNFIRVSNVYYRTENGYMEDSNNWSSEINFSEGDFLLRPYMSIN